MPDNDSTPREPTDAPEGVSASPAAFPSEQFAGVFRDVHTAGQDLTAAAQRGLSLLEQTETPLTGSSGTIAAGATGDGGRGGGGDGSLVLRAGEPPAFVDELATVDFRKMLGGPLQAAVDAQVASSIATMNFINAVGFTGTGNDRKLVMVDFSHTREEKNQEGDPVTKKVVVTVPLISTLQVPSLRIEYVDVEFNARLNSVQRAEVSTELNIKAEVTAGWGPVNFKVSGSFQRKTVTSVEVQREYTLKVNMRAVQDEMPAGLERVLGLLAA